MGGGKILNCPVLTRLGNNMKKSRVISLFQGTLYFFFFPSFLNKLENGRGEWGKKEKKKNNPENRILFVVFFFQI